jgi:hypothetical protein
MPNSREEKIHSNQHSPAPGIRRHSLTVQACHPVTPFASFHLRKSATARHVHHCTYTASEGLSISGPRFVQP